MSDPSDLYVEVHGGEIIVTLPHSTYIATYCKRTDSPHLTMAHLSPENDPRATLTLAEFVGRAWQAANDKALEIGWIV
jgi:hypothetical protein